MSLLSQESADNKFLLEKEAPLDSDKSLQWWISQPTD